MNIVSSRMGVIKPSPTLAVTKKAAELKKAGKNIISLGAGEPDFDTPDNIKLAATEAIKKGYTKYTNVDGSPELKEAVRNKFKRENNLEYSAEEIIVSSGGKQVIYNLFLASLEKGDEVIIPAPYWVSYPDIVFLSEGVPVFVNCSMEDGFKLAPEALEKTISAKSKWLVLNSPSNPTGAAYNREELDALAEVLRKYPNVSVMSDDIYEHIIYGDFKFHTLASVAPDLKDRIFTVNGVSKAYSMTGWRIGYGAGPKELVKAMAVLQSQSTSNPCSISQAAAAEALNGTQDFIKPNALGFKKKRDSALSILSSIDSLECYEPEGAFYLFPKCSVLFGKKSPEGKIIANSSDLATYLLEDAGVAVVPGIAFGSEGYFRISYALSESSLKEACERIISSCRKLC